MNKEQQIDALRTDIFTKDICPDLAAQAKNLVMGDGSLDAEIIFIGEAPGKNEDEQGLPFIGAAGKVLNELLAQAGMERSDVYITNIVKYRPPNNRDPRPDEKAAFLPYLLAQIQIIQPKVVVTLGRHSMEYFLPGAKIGDVHGKVHNVQLDGCQCVVVPLYHPAATIYNRKLRQTLIDDIEALSQSIRQP